jgi:hypothetical protein
MGRSNIYFKNYCLLILWYTTIDLSSDEMFLGQVELRAMAAWLKRPIHIYDSTTPLLIMGEEFASAAPGGGQRPLVVTYHRHYFSLGEHYNSVELIAEECKCSYDR